MSASLWNINTYTNSVSASILNHNISSGSQQAAISALSVSTGSLNTFSASTAASLTNHNLSSASQQASIAALSVSTGSLNARTGSYATTGSNTFVANQVVSASIQLSGSLAVGNITPSITPGRIDASNDIVAFSTSDKRFKNNIEPIKEPIEKIRKISGVEFDWIPNQELHGFTGHDVGVIAQEIQEVLPELVTQRDSGYLAVKYDKIVALLIEGIKEQQLKIESLELEIQELKKQRSL